MINSGIVTFENLPGIKPISVLSGEIKSNFLTHMKITNTLSMTKMISLPNYELEKYDISYPRTSLKTQ